MTGGDMPAIIASCHVAECDCNSMKHGASTIQVHFFACHSSLDAILSMAFLDEQHAIPGHGLRACRAHTPHHKQARRRQAQQDEQVDATGIRQTQCSKWKQRQEEACGRKELTKTTSRQDKGWARMKVTILVVVRVEVKVVKVLILLHLWRLLHPLCLSHICLPFAQ